MDPLVWCLGAIALGMLYNMVLQKSPSNLVAGAFGFAPREYCEVEESAKAQVKVEF